MLWARLCEVLGIPETAADPRFLTNRDRIENWLALKAILNAQTQGKTTAQWMEALMAVQVPCGPINTIDKVVSDPQVLAREMIVPVAHPVAGELKMPGVPIKFSETPASIAGPAPLLGEHVGAIYGGLLGMSEEEIRKLREEGAI